MARLILICAIVVGNLGVNFSQQGAENFSTSKDSTSLNEIHKGNSKPRALFDYQTRIVAYKDLIESRCLLEFLKSGENFVEQTLNQASPGNLTKHFFMEQRQLSKRQIWTIGGQRILDFCRGFPTYLIHDFRTHDNQISILNDLALPEHLESRAKRATKHFFVGRVRGQTQSQYLNFGNSKEPGKAEAESSYGSSKAVVSGSSGMGQAQSQSVPFGCDDCNEPGPDYGSEYSQGQPQPSSYSNGNSKYTYPRQPNFSGSNYPQEPVGSSVPAASRQPDNIVQSQSRYPGEYTDSRNKYPAYVQPEATAYPGHSGKTSEQSINAKPRHENAQSGFSNFPNQPAGVTLPSQQSVSKSNQNKISTEQKKDYPAPNGQPSYLIPPNLNQYPNNFPQPGIIHSQQPKVPDPTNGQVLVTQSMQPGYPPQTQQQSYPSVQTNYPAEPIKSQYSLNANQPALPQQGKPSSLTTVQHSTQGRQPEYTLQSTEQGYPLQPEHSSNILNSGRTPFVYPSQIDQVSHSNSDNTNNQQQPTQPEYRPIYAFNQPGSSKLPAQEYSKVPATFGISNGNKQTSSNSNSGNTGTFGGRFSGDYGVNSRQNGKFSGTFTGQYESSQNGKFGQITHQQYPTQPDQQILPQAPTAQPNLATRYPETVSNFPIGPPEHPGNIHQKPAVPQSYPGNLNYPSSFPNHPASGSPKPHYPILAYPGAKYPNVVSHPGAAPGYHNSGLSRPETQPRYPTALPNQSKPQTTYPAQPPESNNSGEPPRYPGTISGYPGTVSGYPDKVQGYPETDSRYPETIPGYTETVPSQQGTVPGHSEMGQSHPDTIPRYSGAVSGYPGPIQGYPGAVPDNNSKIPKYPEPISSYPRTVPSYPGEKPRYPETQPSSPGTITQYPGTIPTVSSSETIPGHAQTVSSYPGTVPGYPGTVQTYPGTVHEYPGTIQTHPGAVDGYPGTIQGSSERGYPGIRPEDFQTIPNYSRPGNIQSGKAPDSSTSRVAEKRPGSLESMPGKISEYFENGNRSPEANYPEANSNYPNNRQNFPGETRHPSPVESSPGKITQYPDVGHSSTDYGNQGNIPGSQTDDSDSQVQTSVQQTNNETQASASAMGQFAGGTAQSQVSGTYTGSGSFSALAGSDDGKRGALTQVSGGREGAQSSAQGRGGLGQSQAQVQLASETGDTISSAQTGGWNHGSQTQVQASGKGGMADAQSNGPGSTSSQAQIGFEPYDETEKDDQVTPFRGGGMASAQSGSYSGQTQSQIQGKFHQGIRYTGAAQAGTGSKQTVALARNQSRPYPLSGTFSEFKPLTFTPGKNPNTQEQTIQSQSKQFVQKTAPPFTTEKSSTEKPNVSTEVVEDNVTEDYNDEDYDYEEENVTQKPSTRSIISQTSENQRQHIILDPLEELDATVTQSHGDFPKDGTILQPGQYIPGSLGYQIPAGFRGRVKSIASGQNTYASGRNSQAQSVTLTPGSGRIIYKKPVYAVASNTHFQNGHVGFGSGYTYQPARYQVKSGKSLPNFVSLTKSESGSKNLYTGQKTPSVYYTQSSSCGVFTNTCIFNGSGKLCFPKPKTNPDGTFVSC